MTYTPLVASIDIGTTSTRAILFARDGLEVAKHQIEYLTTASLNSAVAGGKLPQEVIFSSEGILITQGPDVEIEAVDVEKPTLAFPNPGWVECDPTAILANAVQCLAACMATLDKVNATEGKDYKVASIGITNMRETTVVWLGKTGKALHNGIVWNDMRTVKIVEDMKKKLGAEKAEKLRQRCGVPLSTYFSASKLRWLLDNLDEVRAAYDAADGDLYFGTIDLWLIFQLTKERLHVSDVTNAARTMFMDLETRDYNEELLEVWGFDRKKVTLPKVVSSSEYYGAFATPDVVALGHSIGLSGDGKKLLEKIHGVPICGCLGDQLASLVGQLTLKKGGAKCTYGTGAFLLYNTGSTKLILNAGALTTFGFWFPLLEGEEAKPHYALEGSIAVSGSVVQWLRDNLKMITNAAEVGPLASQVDSSGGVVFVPGFSGLFAPYWDSGARGTILGLTQYSNSAHIARAALEGVCYQVRAILRAMASDAGADPEFLEKAKQAEGSAPLLSLAVDGGMSKLNEVMQIQADILGPCVRVIRSPAPECTALGAAIAAGLYKQEDPAARVWTSLDDVTELIAGTISADNEFAAKLDGDKRRQGWKMWERAVERTKGWADEDDE